MDNISDLTADEIDILIFECQKELKDATARLAHLVIERDELRRKIRIWKEELDVLELLKSGVNFEESLIEINPTTMRTIQKRFNDAALKYNQNFATDENKLRVEPVKSEIAEIFSYPVDLSQPIINEPLPPAELSYNQEQRLKKILNRILEKYSQGVSLPTLQAEYKLSLTQLSLIISIKDADVILCIYCDDRVNCGLSKNEIIDLKNGVAELVERCGIKN
jgi:hypothetical protein